MLFLHRITFGEVSSLLSLKQLVKNVCTSVTFILFVHKLRFHYNKRNGSSLLHGLSCHLLHVTEINKKCCNMLKQAFPPYSNAMQIQKNNSSSQPSSTFGHMFHPHRTLLYILSCNTPGEYFLHARSNTFLAILIISRHPTIIASKIGSCGQNIANQLIFPLNSI